MMIYIARGDYHLGITTTDKAGNVVREQPSRFEEKDDGACVAIGRIDTEKDELGPATSIYADWQASWYLGEVLAQLGKTRPIDIPNFKAIVQAMEKDLCWGKENPVCEYCMKIGVRGCGQCVVRQWKEETSEE